MKDALPQTGLSQHMPMMFERIAKKVAAKPGNQMDIKWRGVASCLDTDPELFFPVGATGLAVTQIEEAREVCMGCACQEKCLEFALRTNQDAGVWGGSSEEERRHLRRTYLSRRRIKAIPPKV